MTKVSKADQVRYGIWMRMREYGKTIEEISKLTGYDECEIQEFFDR